MSQYIDDDWDFDDSFDEEDDFLDEEDEEEAYRREREERRRSTRDSRRRKSRGSVVLKILIVVFALVFAVSAYQVVTLYLAYQTAIDEYDRLDSYIEKIPEEEGVTVTYEDEEEEALRYPALSIDYEGLRQINEEFVGVIHIPVLDLTYPVAQADDNEKYLTQTFEGTANSSGCIFLDMYASPDFSDSNTFLFGHNMKNQTMFGSLKLFLQNEELCDEDPYVYIYQEDQVLIYRIFAYYTIPVDDDVYEDFYGEEGYDAYVQDALSHSSYALEDDVVDWTKRPNLLTLSTCYSTGHTHNFVVQCVQEGIAQNS